MVRGDGTSCNRCMLRDVYEGFPVRGAQIIRITYWKVFKNKTNCNSPLLP